MTKLIVAFRNIANAPKKILIPSCDGMLCNAHSGMTLLLQIFKEFIFNPLHVFKIPDRLEVCDSTYLSPYFPKYLLYISATPV